MLVSADAKVNEERRVKRLFRDIHLGGDLIPSTRPEWADEDYKPWDQAVAVQAAYFIGPCCKVEGHVTHGGSIRRTFDHVCVACRTKL